MALNIDIPTRRNRLLMMRNCVQTRGNQVIDKGVCRAKKLLNASKNYRTINWVLSVCRSYQLEREVEDASAIRRNRERSDISHAITIQRAWRAHHRRKFEDHLVDFEYEPTDSGLIEPVYSDDISTVSTFKGAYRTVCPNRTDEFDDSLEDNLNENQSSSYDERGEHSHSSFLGEFISDRVLTEQLVREGIRKLAFESPDSRSSSIKESLPSPTTDWDTIESVLQPESGINSPEDGTDGEESDIVSKLNRSGPTLQMCFVDDNDSSITDNDSDPEVKVYLVDDEHTPDYLNGTQPYTDISATTVNLLQELDRDLDSRDSGYVPGDLVDLNIERVTDIRRMKNATPPEEESARVLNALELHGKQEEQQKEKDTQRKILVHQMELKSTEELIRIKYDLRRKIQEISDQLVTELMSRDTLHAEQDSLLMDVEDLTKLAQEKQKIQGLHEQSKTRII